MNLKEQLNQARSPQKSMLGHIKSSNKFSLPKIWFDDNDTCVGINEAAQDFLQVHKSLLLGLSMQALFYRLQADSRHVESCINLSGPIECNIKNGCGELKIVRIYFERVSWPETSRLELSFLDLTLSRRDMTKLIEAESKYRTFANAIPQLAWMADETGAIFWHSERFFEFTGASSDSILGFSWIERIAPEHRDRFVQLAHTHIASGHIAEAILKVKSVEFGYQWCLVRSIPIKNQKGQVLRWFGNATPLPDILTSQLPSDGFIPDHPSAFSR